MMNLGWPSNDLPPSRAHIPRRENASEYECQYAMTGQIGGHYPLTSSHFTYLPHVSEVPASTACSNSRLCGYLAGWSDTQLSPAGGSMPSCRQNPALAAVVGSAGRRLP